MKSKMLIIGLLIITLIFVGCDNKSKYYDSNNVINDLNLTDTQIIQINTTHIAIKHKSNNDFFWICENNGDNCKTFNYTKGVVSENIVNGE